jgi:hypothetical protein
MKRIKKSPYTPLIIAGFALSIVVGIACHATAQKTGQSFVEVVYNSMK